MKRACIDIGSNTTLLLIGDLIGESLEELENESRVTGLGRDLDKGKCFLEIAMKDTYDALNEYSGIIDKYNIPRGEVIMTATEASRVAINSKGFFDKVELDLGLKVTLISSEGEAYLTALGVVRGSKTKKDGLTIMDIGGASTEFIKIKSNPFEVIDSLSLPFGSVRATDWLKDGVFDMKIDDIMSKHQLDEYKGEHLLCVAGSMTCLGAMIKGLKEFDANEVNGTKVSFCNFLTFKESIRKLSRESLDEKYPFLGKRAGSIIGGTLLGEKIGKKLDVETFEISTLGLRYGTLYAGEIDERFRIKQ